jgi:hypothetical protein
MSSRPIIFSGTMVRAILDGRKTQTRRLAPHGKPGDRLWVRESWRVCSRFDVHPPRSLHIITGDIEYLADGDAIQRSGRTRHPLHMPREFSRILLEVTDARRERLQDITEEDAKAEGAMYHDGSGINHSGWRHDYKDVHLDARSSFARLWESIHGPGSWDVNPLVWVVKFRRVTP